MSVVGDPVQAILKGRDLMLLPIGECWNIIDVQAEQIESLKNEIEDLKGENTDLREQIKARYRL